MRVILIILVFSAVVHSKDFSFEDVQKVVEKVSNSKFVQQAKKLAAVAGPMYEVITFALDFFTESDSEKFERYFEEIKESLKEIKGKLNNIVSQLSVIESRINTIGLELRQDVRYQSFFTYYAEISSAVNLFETTILNHRGSLGDFKRRLNEFISKYEDNNWEFKLVYFGTTALNTHKSLIDAIIDVSINSENNNENEFISSTQQVVFEFYMSTFMKIYEGGALLKFCYILRQHANGAPMNNYEDLFGDRLKPTLETLTKSMKQKLSSLSDSKHTKSFDSFKNPVDVQFKNVLQNFMENEEQLSNVETCTDDCPHFRNHAFSGGDGCYGTVRNCEQIVPLHSSNEQYTSVGDRIYSGYTIDGELYGNNLGSTLEKSSWLKGFVNCHVCRCICDQTGHPRTVRKLSTRKVEAPQGHVIVGVRFSEKNKVIGLQIQTGEMMPMGLVNADTIKWQEMPDDVGWDFFWFSFDDRFFYLTEASFPQAVMTGIQFGKDLNTVTFKIFGKGFKDRSLGILEANEQSIDPINYIRYEGRDNLIPGIDRSAHGYSTRYQKSVHFGVSNEKNDAGQTFVPFFDGSDVSLQSKAPISGVGFMLFTKGEDYAGYIRPYLKTYNYANFVQ